jgi:beta-galactosidase
VRLTGGHLDVKLDMHGVDTMRFGVTLHDTLLWHRAHPTQLSLRVENRLENRKSEVYDFAVSLRELHYEDDTFYINGEATPMAWYDMSSTADVAAVARASADGHYALRFGAGVVSDEVLTYCDMMGIYVALTAPINSSLSGESRKRGGNPSNDPSWREEYVERVVSLVETTKRHASVVAYYLADDSANGICLYEAYLAMKQVSGSRPVFYDDGGNEWNSD